MFASAIPKIRLILTRYKKRAIRIQWKKNTNNARVNREFIEVVPWANKSMK